MRLLDANEVGQLMYDMLVDSVNDTMPEASDDEKEQSVYRILVALSNA
jgi:hypothetical protein